MFGKRPWHGIASALLMTLAAFAPAAQSGTVVIYAAADLDVIEPLIVDS